MTKINVLVRENQMNFLNALARLEPCRGSGGGLLCTLGTFMFLIHGYSSRTGCKL